MKLVRTVARGEADQSLDLDLDLDLADCAEIAAALQQRFPDIGAYDLLRGVFQALEARLVPIEPVLH